MAKLQQRRTSVLIWVAAIICAFLAIAVIISGIVVFVTYLIVRPKIPVISVTSAHLDQFHYYQYGQLDTQITLQIAAQNDNSKAHASFSDFKQVLYFAGIPIAELRAPSFEVPKNTTISLMYIAKSDSIPLNDDAMEEVNVALRRDQIVFNIQGSVRTRWKVGILVSFKYWTHLSCPLTFVPSNGSSIHLRCSSKAG